MLNSFSVVYTDKTEIHNQRYKHKLEIDFWMIKHE